MRVSYLVFIFSFGLAFPAPQGMKTEGKVAVDEMVIRLVLHVQKTEKGAQLVVNLEDNAQDSNPRRASLKPLASLSTDMGAWTKKENETTPTENLESKSAIVELPLFRRNFVAQNNIDGIKVVESKNFQTNMEPKRNEYYQPISNDNIRTNSETKTYKHSGTNIEPKRNQYYQSVPESNENRRMNSEPKKPQYYEAIPENSENHRSDLDIKTNEYRRTYSETSKNPYYQTISENNRQANLEPKRNQYYQASTENYRTNFESKKNEYRPTVSFERPKLEFKISIGPNQNQNVSPKFKNMLQTTTPRFSTWKKFSTTTEMSTTESTTDNETENGDVSNVNKAVADEGFGVLASRCSSFAPGLVSDGAGGCTKPANRPQKSYQNPYRFRTAETNELPSDVKTDHQENLEVAAT